MTEVLDHTLCVIGALMVTGDSELADDLVDWARKRYAIEVRVDPGEPPDLEPAPGAVETLKQKSGRMLLAELERKPVVCPAEKWPGEPHAALRARMRQYANDDRNLIVDAPAKGVPFSVRRVGTPKPK